MALVPFMRALHLTQPRCYATGKAYRIDFRPYDPPSIESRWQAEWARASSTPLRDFASPTPARPIYVLPMFPYPSGALHMGHARVYTISDTLARFWRARGRRVLHPIGWDSFGLPAENAARERKVDAAQWTAQNIAQMRETLRGLGVSFDWAHEVSTADVSYYRWTQWLFLELHAAGLAYQADATVHWDPVDLTVLANEQVDANGRSWRSGAIVEKRKMRQWFFRHTPFPFGRDLMFDRLKELAPDLLADLDTLTHWPPHVVKMQREWLGRRAGALIRFKVDGAQGHLDAFTTRAETIFGATFVAIAPEHPLLEGLTLPGSLESVRAYVAQTERFTDTQRRESKEVLPLGCSVRHPLTGELLPIYVARYVLADVGTGVVMGVPAHDTRDWELAQREGLQVRRVLKPLHSGEDQMLPYTGEGIMVDSDSLNGLVASEARLKAVDLLKQLDAGMAHETWQVRDWLVSRQRYWGCPIPIVHCIKCGTVPLPASELPVRLPHDLGRPGPHRPLDSPEHADWRRCTCPQCGGPALRETDTMDTFVDSAWYFLRYPSPVGNAPWIRAALDATMPVDFYIGGVEHAILHLLYARFIMKALYNRGLVPSNEPFRNLLTQGMVQGATYRNSNSDKPIPSDQVSWVDGTPVDRSGSQLTVTWEKMSKSKHNGVSPESALSDYGADAVRLFLLFKAPMEAALDWDVKAIQGPLRWLHRLWAIYYNFFASISHVKERPTSSDTYQVYALVEAANDTISCVTKDLGGDRGTPLFNVAVARLMKLSNTIQELTLLAGHLPPVAGDFKPVAIASHPSVKDSLRALLGLLGPMAPHITAELWTSWRLIVEPQAPLFPPWPELLPSHSKQVNGSPLQKKKLVIQRNGRKLGELIMPLPSDEPPTEPAVRSFIAGSPLASRVTSLTTRQIRLVPVRDYILVNIIVDDD